MSEKQAKRHLRKMLGSFTPGSILHLLADLFRQEAEKARRDGDPAAYEHCRIVENALFVIGLGIEAVVPADL